MDLLFRMFYLSENNANKCRTLVVLWRNNRDTWIYGWPYRANIKLRWHVLRFFVLYLPKTLSKLFMKAPKGKLFNVFCLLFLSVFCSFLKQFHTIWSRNTSSIVLWWVWPSSQDPGNRILIRARVPIIEVWIGRESNQKCQHVSYRYGTPTAKDLIWSEGMTAAH